MAETTQNIVPQEHIPETITPPDTVETLVQLSPGLSIEIERYKKSITRLSQEQQQSLIRQWKDEVSHGTATIGILNTLIKQSYNSGLSKKEEKIEQKEEKIEQKEEKIEQKDMAVTEKNNGKINELNNVATAADSANKYTNKINDAFGGKFTNEIQRELQTDIERPETQAFLATLGVDTKNPEALKDPQVQDILKARAGVQVCMRYEKEILEKPELVEDMKNLKSLWLKLNGSGSAEAKNIGNLLIDQPKSDREAITSTVNSLTKGSPDTMITRTGDRLSWEDKSGSRYEIDMAVRPPQLSKSLRGLSVSRDVSPLSREEQEKSDKKIQTEKQLKSSQDTLSQSRNEFWQVRRDEYTLQGENRPDGTPPTNLYSQYIGENRWDHTRYETLEQAYAQGEVAEKDRISTLEQMQSISEEMRGNNAKKILDGSISASDREKITNMLEKRISHLNTLKRSEESLARIDKKALEYTPSGGDTVEWEKHATKSLTTLSNLGLHHLGQQRFEEVMEAWNLTNKSSKEYQIDLSQNPRIDDIQERKFTEAINKFVGPGKNKNEAFVNLAKNLTQEQFNTSNWKNQETRAKFLFGDQKSDMPTL